jgi:hypothetical protein
MYRITIHPGTINIKKEVIPVISCKQNTILGLKKKVPWMMGMIETSGFFLLPAYCFIYLQPPWAYVNQIIILSASIWTAYPDN